MQNTQNAAGTALDNPSGPETENQMIVIGGMMSPAAMKLRIESDREMRRMMLEYVKSEMVLGHDYDDKIGNQKVDPFLKQGGARKITSLYNCWFGPPEIEETWLDSGHYRVRAHIKVYNKAGDPMTSGDAMCSTMESKYAYRKAERVCPDCHQAAIRKDNKSTQGGFYCWSKIGGCGGKYAADDERITEQQLGRVDNPDLADVENTVLKMAVKRAKVAAVCDLPGVSGLFAPEPDDTDDSNQQPAKAKGTSRVNDAPEQTTSPVPPNGTRTPSSAADSESSVEKAVRISKKLLEHKCEMEDLVVQFLPEGVAKFEDLTEEQADEAVPSMIELLNGKIKGH